MAYIKNSDEKVGVFRDPAGASRQGGINFSSPFFADAKKRYADRVSLWITP